MEYDLENIYKSGRTGKDSCYRCEKRHPNGHSSCEIYKRYRERLDKIKGNKQ